MGKANEKNIQWEIDRRLAERYAVREVLAQSSTCCLYRVRDVFRESTYLAAGPGAKLAAREGGLEWFEEYCKKMQEVPAHPNVLTPKRLDHEGSVPFLLLPDAEGQFWDQAIKQGQLTELSEMLDVATQVARGVAWLHRHDTCHYNLKPANVIVCRLGFAKVWKYGQARARTRAYASPEQLNRDRELGPPTDVWSWGLCVLCMFQGAASWYAGDEAPEALSTYVENGPLRRGLPQMPDQLVELLRQAFQRNPDRRPGEMTEIVGELEGLSNSLKTDYEEPVTLEPADTGEEPPADEPAEADSAQAEQRDEGGGEQRRAFRDPRGQKSDTGHWRLHQQ